MKQKVQWIVGLFTIASTGLALGCGCASERPRLQPVREVIIQQQTTCAMEPTSRLDWGAPFRTVGHVISAPFVAIGNAFTPSERYTEPVGERLMTCPGYYERSYTSTRLMPVGEQYSTVRIQRERILEPVSEQYTTVRIIQSNLLPVGERVKWVKKHHHHRTMIKPVGERFIYEKRFHQGRLQPTGERFIMEKRYHKTTLKPVGEKKTIQKSYQKTMVQPVGQKQDWQKNESLK